MEVDSVDWLAGLLEGEGTFFTCKSHVNGKIYRYPYVSVNMTDEDVVQRVCNIFGTKITVLKKLPNRKQQWKCTAYGARAVEIMKSIRPLMSKRRSDKIDEILKYYSEKEEPNNLRRAYSSKRATERWEEIRNTGRKVIHGFKLAPDPRNVI